ncbi:unnamed protein product, partial [Coccothraustes coccothraustes]
PALSQHGHLGLPGSPATGTAAAPSAAPRLLLPAPSWCGAACGQEAARPRAGGAGAAPSHREPGRALR